MLLMVKCSAPVWLLLLAACAAPAAALHGTAYSPPKTAPNFRLTDQNGRRFSLQQNTGMAIALYFGFTHCRDVCPETLRLLGRARSLAHLRDTQLEVVMVTVDPARDDPQSLRSFFQKTGVQALGLTGSASELARVYKQYGVAVEPGTRDLVHSDAVYLIDPQGRLREALDPQTPLNDVAQDLRTVVDS